MRTILPAIIATLFLSVLPMQAQSYKQLWQQLEEYQRKDLPKSVAETAYTIYKKAKSQQDAPQMTKAYLTMMEARYKISSDSLAKDVAFLKQWVGTEKEPVNAAVLHSILASMTIQTAPREAFDYICKSLYPVKELGDCPAERYAPLTVDGEASVLYEGNRMYPLLAHRAIKLLDRNSSLLYDSKIDVNKEIEKCYDDLLSYFKVRGARAAYVLNRVMQIRDTPALYKNGSEQLIQAYQELIDNYKDVETCADAYLYQAMAWNTRKEKGKAVALLEEAIRKYPEYKRLNTLRKVWEEYALPIINLSLNTLYPGKEEIMDVEFRNLSAFKLNIYRTDVTDIVKIATYRKDDSYWKDKWTLLRTDSYTLNPGSDYARKDTTLAITMPEEGYYLFEAIPEGCDQAFNTNPQVVYVSALGIMVGDNFQGRRSAMVVDRMSGKSLAGAEVTFYRKKDTTYVLKTEKNKEPIPLITDKRGIVSWTTDSSMDFRINDYMRVSTKEHPCMPLIGSREYNKVVDDELSGMSMSVFADRGIYRPGQTVYASGILYGQERDSVFVKVNTAVNVVIYDAKRKEIARKQLRTNEYGSFHTDLALPTACLPGYFELAAMIEEGDEVYETTSFRVEEYKRPLFIVTFNSVEVPYKMGDTVMVRGTAQMLTGIPIQNATVKYTIQRMFPVRNPAKDGEQSGTIQTDTKGLFAIPLVLQSERENENFRCRVEVTTKAGDTQRQETSLFATAQPYLLGIRGISDVLLRENKIPVSFDVHNNQGRKIKENVHYQVMKLSLDENREKHIGKIVLEGDVESNTENITDAIYRLASGDYRITMTLSNGCSKTEDFTLFSLKEKNVPDGVECFVYKTGEEFGKGIPSIHFATSLKDVHVLVNQYSTSGWMDTYSFAISDSICSIPFPYKEEFGDELKVSFAFMKNGRLYQQDRSLRRIVDKKLTLKWKTFRDKLQVGSKEEWTLRILDAQGKAVDAELLATLYDASLDQLYPREWWHVQMNLLVSLPYLRTYYYGVKTKRLSVEFPRINESYKEWKFSDFKRYAIGNMPVTLILMDQQNERGGSGFMVGSVSNRKMASDIVVAEAVFEEEKPTVLNNQINLKETAVQVSDKPIELRENFAETAFFYPQLRTNEKGEVNIVFTLPESLTTWRFMALAHTREMKNGVIDTTVVASKDFMLQANLPRFVRVGDRTSFVAILSNLTDKRIKGTVRMELFDPMTEKVFHTAKQRFTVIGNGTATVSFSYDIPNTYKVMACRMVADGGSFSDGEQHLLPVLEKKEWMTESVAVAVNQAGTKQVDLKHLFNNQSLTATNRRLTVEFTGNPAWMAVLALPTIGSPSDQNAVSLTAAYYSASLASFIVDSYPQIRKMFEVWKAQGGVSKDVFMSELQKNQELKELLLENSPFLLDAENEEEQRQRLATLFDVNTLETQQTLYADKLKGLQNEDGGWSWYKGMKSNPFITSLTVETLLRLQNTIGKPDGRISGILSKGLAYLDKLVVKEYKMNLKLSKGHTYELSEFVLHNLYIHALSDRKPEGETKKAYNYFLQELKKGSRDLTIYGKAASALVLAKGGEEAASKDFLQSLLEYSVSTPEMGRYYDTNIAHYSWADYRVPTQTIVIEVLHKLGADKQIIAEMQQWLLKQKQVQSWTTPVNTVNAVYALLLDDTALLANRPAPELLLDGKPLAVADASLGLNAIKKSIDLPAETQAPQTFTVKQQQTGVAWGAVYAQYTEEMDKIGSHTEGLSVIRTFYVERMLNGNWQWVELKGGDKLQVGDKVKAVLRLHADRDMDFVQLKENRAACMEPVAVLSGYCWDKGVGYYRAIKDASIEYYMDCLYKGDSTIESVYHITLPGTYEVGTVKLQSAYAPEFNAHTSSLKLEVLK